MASLLTGNPLNYTGKQALDYVMLPGLEVGTLDDTFTIKTGVKVKQQVAFISPVNKITKADAGCGTGKGSATINRTVKTWDPQPVKAWLSQCAADVAATFEEDRLNGGNDRTDLTTGDTYIQEKLLEVITPAAARDIRRMAWLGKKTILAAALTNGSADVPNYNQVDGIWTKIKAGVAGGTIKRVTIAKNGQSTVSAQALAAGEASTLLGQVLVNSDITLKQYPRANQTFIVTRTIYENYEMELASKGTLESSFAKLQDGSTTLSYFGIALQVEDILDQYIQTDFLLSGAYTEPHRIVLVAKGNLQLSVDTDSTDPIAMETWYERKDEEWNTRMKYKLDAMVANDSYISVGF